MKNKKLVYLLLPLVIIVWGLIFYRIFSVGENDEFLEINKKNDKIPFIEDTVSKEEITLIAYYRDPFLGRNNSPSILRNSSSVSKVLITSPVLKTQPSIVWPQVSYSGIIENKNKKNKIAIVKIDEQQFLAREKEIINNVLLEKIFRDSIRVVFNRERKTIRK